MFCFESRNGYEFRSNSLLCNLNRQFFIIRDSQFSISRNGDIESRIRNVAEPGRRVDCSNLQPVEYVSTLWHHAKETCIGIVDKRRPCNQIVVTRSDGALSFHQTKDQVAMVTLSQISDLFYLSLTIQNMVCIKICVSGLKIGSNRKK